MKMDFIVKTVFVFMTSLLMLCSCGSGKADRESTETVKQNETIADRKDFSALRSGKYAAVFAQQDKEKGYTLRWSYGSGNEDKPQNYITYDGSDGSYALCLSQPAFNRNKFFVRDHTMYDIYDDDRDYYRTDMNRMATEYGYFSADEFEKYACDIFSGLYYLGSGEEEADGKTLAYDAYFTDKQMEIRLYTNENGELTAMKSVPSDAEPVMMYIDEFTQKADRSLFEIPEGYTEYKDQ